MDTVTERAATSTLPAVSQRGWIVGWARRNAHSVTSAALYAAALSALLTHEFVQDSWLAIAGGRDIAHNGLPWHERLTSIAYGEPWIDQQWLGKLFLYGLVNLGGVRLLAAAHVFLVLSAMCAAIAIARRRGASDSSVFWVVLAVLLMSPWGWQLRTQSLAYLLFVAVLGILTAARIRPSVRVVACIPLIVVWANVHGSVTLAALLVTGGAMHALWLELPKRRPSRIVAGSALSLLPVASLFVSPYGLHLVSYYRSLLGNPLMGQYIAEWRAPTMRSAYIFFAIAAVVLWLASRYGGVLTAMERWALVVTGFTGFMTIRGIVWFGLAAVLIVPKLLDARSARRERTQSSALLVTLASACCAMAIVALGVQLARVPQALDARYPSSAAQALASAAARDNTSRVFASERYADWLLWEEPQLAGRLVYDVRFELFDASRFAELAAFHEQGAISDEITRGARLLVLDGVLDEVAVRTLIPAPGSTVLYNDGAVVVLARDPSPETG